MDRAINTSPARATSMGGNLFEITTRGSWFKRRQSAGRMPRSAYTLGRAARVCTTGGEWADRSGRPGAAPQGGAGARGSRLGWGLIAALLRQEGYRAVRAWDTQEALRLAKGRSPDLVLLDLNLAYPDGLEVLEAGARQ